MASIESGRQNLDVNNMGAETQDMGTVDTSVNLKKELPLRERILQAVDQKIAEDPFYTGYNSAVFGLFTPRLKNKAQLHNPSFSSGSTPEDFYAERESEKKELESTPESLHLETEREAKERSEPLDTKTADEAFKGSLMVRQEPKTGMVWRRNFTKLSWAGQINWERDMEIAGKYLGGEQTLPEIANEYGMTLQRIRDIVGKITEDVHIKKSFLRSKKPLGKEESKPHYLFDLRAKLDDPESTASQIILGLQNGTGIRELNKKYGAEVIGRLRGQLKEFMGEKAIPHAYMHIENPDYFKALKDPNTSKAKKVGLFGEIYSTYNQIRSHSEIPVLTINKAFSEIGLDIDPKRVPALLDLVASADSEIVVHSKKAKNGFYRFIAEGDLERLRAVVDSNPEFDYYKRPSVESYGKPYADLEKSPNTTELKKNKSKKFKQGAGYIPREIRRLIGSGDLQFSDIIGSECPGRVHVERSGNMYMEIEEGQEDEFKKYIDEKVKFVRSNLGI